VECEVLLPQIARRGQRMLEAMIAAAPIPVRVSDTYRGGSKLLMSYGLGHLGRKRFTDAHVANGGRLIGWDMGYWNRSETMRVTVDADHPWRLMRDMPGDRWKAAGIALRQDADPDGPVILVGMGPKSRVQFGLGFQEWERDTLAAIRAAYPGRKVIYKPKKLERLGDLPVSHAAIEDVLTGASLVVCRHSNVSVDACIAGVPVVCEDGAGRALYGPDLRNPVSPGVVQRQRFLENLAWWQWRPEEASKAWQFLLAVCG
jgi:hypothetical protein